jgi:hypothetical protein
VEYTDYFEGLPLDVQWERAMLSKQELEQVKYIEYDYWVELSSGSRLPRDGARNILAGDEVFGISHQGVLQMAEVFRKRLVESAPEVKRWHFMMDNLDTHRSEALVRWVADLEGIEQETDAAKKGREAFFV